MQKKTVLIVDDVKIVCSSIKMELSGQGYDADYAVEDKKALKMAETKKYDIVFLDLLMNNTDGVFLCREIKGKLPEAKIILMTGSVDRDLEKRVLEFVKAGGSKSYLIKPFQPGEVVEVIKSALAEK